MSKERANILYRGFEITHGYDDQNKKDTYQVSSESWQTQSASLEAILTRIDNMLKQPFDRCKVFWEYYNEEFRTGEATSISEGGEVWVFNEQGRREKIERVWHDTVKNRAIYTEICSLRKEFDNITEKHKKEIKRRFSLMTVLGKKQEE